MHREERVGCGKPSSLSGDPFAHRIGALWLVAIFLLALMWRLLLFRGGVPFVDIDLRGDEGNYFALAKGLLETGQFPDRWAWTRPPLYPAFLAAVFSVSGFELTAVVAAQALLGAVAALLVAVLAVHEYGRRVGAIAGLLAAMDPTAPLQSLYLFSEGASMPFALVGAILFLKGLRGGGLFPLVAAGIAFGIGALVRVTVLPFALGLASWLVLARLRRGLMPVQGMALLLGLAIALTPWTVRNWSVYQRPVLVDTTLGVNLYQYNSDLSRRQVYSELMRIPNPAERQTYGMAMAFQWIASHPREFLARALERLRYSWTADRFAEWGIALKAKIPEAPSWMVMSYASLGTLWYLGLCVLAFLGMGIARGTPYRGLSFTLVAVYTGITVFIGSAFRYKLALMPYLFPLAALAVANQRWRWHLLPYAALGLAVVGLSVPLVWPALPKDVYAHMLYGRGRVEELMGFIQAAENSYRAAIAVDPRADFYIGLARVLASEGQVEEAKELLGEISLKWEEDPRACVLLIHLARLQGEPSQTCRTSVLFSAAATRWAWDRLPIEPRSVVDVGEDDLGYIIGVYAPEGDGAMYRWTSQVANVRLWSPSSRVALRIKCTTGPLPAMPFQVYVSGAPVAVLVAPQARWADYLIDLPGHYRPGELLPVNLVSQGVRLQGDGRRLGIVVSRIGLESVVSSAEKGPSGP
jgi:4-amino-4-deoxy-L-arabinose transferase-like glycosyltransferase